MGYEYLNPDQALCVNVLLNSDQFKPFLLYVNQAMVLKIQSKNVGALRWEKIHKFSKLEEINLRDLTSEISRYPAPSAA